MWLGAKATCDPTGNRVTYDELAGTNPCARQRLTAPIMLDG